MVQNGKFSAVAWLLVKTLKNVDFLELKIQKQVNLNIKNLTNNLSKKKLTRSFILIT